MLVLKMFSIISLLVLCFVGNSQIYSSSCVATQSVVNSYQDDADRLVLECSINLDWSEADSIQILNSNSDTAMRSRLGVFNLAGTVAAADTVVTMFNIHSWENPARKE
jgi:hypothetical protein